MITVLSCRASMYGLWPGNIGRHVIAQGIGGADLLLVLAEGSRFH